MSMVNPLQYLFNPRGKMPAPGSDVTVNASYFEDDGLGAHGAGWRFVIDLADITSSHMVVVPGNSGHPRSPFYNNNIDLWLTGELYQTGLEAPYQTGLNPPHEGEPLTLVPE
jgi:penicillin amidase